MKLVLKNLRQNGRGVTHIWTEKNEKISLDTGNILENFIKDVSLNIRIFKIDTLNYLNMICFIIKTRIN